MLIACSGRAPLTVFSAQACTGSASRTTRRFFGRLKSTVAITPSSVDRGTRFENGTLHYLTRTFPSMQLLRTGGANDGGVDLLGWWHISTKSENNAPATSTTAERIRVVVQCKNEQKKLGPIHIRELRGVAARVMSNSDDGLVILASSNGFSKQCLLQGLAWDFPLLFLHLLASPDTPNAEEKDLGCISLLPNDALSQMLLRGQMEIKHVTSLDDKGQRQTVPAIFINGKRTRQSN
ncbi:hypothetical protein CBS101457_004840 [Exobasidium rhododendri]|nr:hypothetical protein CBS101457_004840 [Exobasidium rhododendri]